MKKSKTQLTTKQLKQAAQNLWFNPNTPGPLKIIADQNDTIYYLRRAQEEISHMLDSGISDEQLVTALRLLVLVRASRGYLYDNS